MLRLRAVVHSLTIPKITLEISSAWPIAVHFGIPLDETDHPGSTSGNWARTQSAQ